MNEELPKSRIHCILTYLIQWSSSSPMIYGVDCFRISSFQRCSPLLTSHIPEHRFSSSHRTFVTDPEIPRINLVRSSGLIHMLTSQHYGSGFIRARARVLVNETLESPIPDFLKRVISRHMSFSNRTIHNYSRVSTMESPDLLSPELPSSRFPISQNGKSHDTCPPSFKRSRSILDLSPLVSEV